MRELWETLKRLMTIFAYTCALLWGMYLWVALSRIGVCEYELPRSQDCHIVITAVPDGLEPEP